MVIYDLLKNLIDNNYYEKEDMLNKLNVFYAFNQITLEQYTELMSKVNPTVIEKEVINTEVVKEDTITE